MALFVCNYQYMLKGINYWGAASLPLGAEEVLYIVDTDDWKVDKITVGELAKHWSDELDVVNIDMSPSVGALLFTEIEIDFTEYGRDSHMYLGNEEYGIQFTEVDGLVIEVRGVEHNLIYTRVDYQGYEEGSSYFNETGRWCYSLSLDGKNICSVYRGLGILESASVNIAYAFKIKELFVVRLACLFEDEPVPVTLVFRGSTLIDVYSSGENEEVFELDDFEPIDTIFQTKSKIKGEPY